MPSYLLDYVRRRYGSHRSLHHLDTGEWRVWLEGELRREDVAWGWDNHRRQGALRVLMTGPFELITSADKREHAHEELCIRLPLVVVEEKRGRSVLMTDNSSEILDEFLSVLSLFMLARFRSSGQIMRYESQSYRRRFGPRGSSQIRPTEITSKPANGLGARQVFTLYS